MSTQTTTRPWYLDDDGEGGGFSAVCSAMRELALTDVLNGDEEVWEEFSRFIRSTALDQEVYGEYLMEGGQYALGPMWTAFRSGWSSRAGLGV